MGRKKRKGGGGGGGGHGGGHGGDDGGKKKMMMMAMMCMKMKLMMVRVQGVSERYYRRRFVLVLPFTKLTNKFYYCAKLRNLDKNPNLSSTISKEKDRH